MTRRVNRRGTLVLTLALATVFSAVWFVGAQQPPAPTTVRGNVPGEWRYWGGDAWSTRYSSLDQINASNFNSLKVAWQWDAKSAGAGPDEYYRTTPLYANGRLFTVASTRRAAFGIDPADGKTLWKYELDEGIRWQKAPRQFAGRGLAYWSQGTEERIILVTPGYHMVLLDAKTGKPDPKFGKDGVVDLMDGLGLPLVPLAVDDPGSLVISDVFPYRQAKPGEKWDAEKKIGADGTVGIDPKYGQIAASSPAIVVNNVIIVGNSSIHGYYPVRVRNIPGYIRGFDIRTGKQLWKTDLHRGEVDTKANKRASSASSTVACDGKRIFINFKHLEAVVTTALDLDGNVLWQKEISPFITHQGFGSSPALLGDLVYVSSDNKGPGGGVVAALHRGKAIVLAVEHTGRPAVD